LESLKTIKDIELSQVSTNSENTVPFYNLGQNQPEGGSFNMAQGWKKDYSRYKGFS
jgi:hypothetical protein